MIFKEGYFGENADCGEYEDGCWDCEDDPYELGLLLCDNPTEKVDAKVRELEERPVVPTRRCAWLRRWRILDLKASVAFTEGGSYDDGRIWHDAVSMRYVLWTPPMDRVPAHDLVCQEKALACLREAAPFTGERAAALKMETERSLEEELEELRAVVPPEEIPPAREALEAELREREARRREAEEVARRHDEEIAALKARLRAKRLAREAEEAMRLS